MKAAGCNFILNIRDDGKGIPESKLKFGSLGVWSMQERARLAGGTLSIVSVEGKGTTVALQIPGELDETSSDCR